MNVRTFRTYVVQQRVKTSNESKIPVHREWEPVTINQSKTATMMTMMAMMRLIDSDDASLPSTLVRAVRAVRVECGPTGGWVATACLPAAPARNAYERQPQKRTTHNETFG